MIRKRCALPFVFMALCVGAAQNAASDDLQYMHESVVPIYEALQRDKQYICADAFGLLVGYGHVLHAPYVFRVTGPMSIEVNGWRIFPPPTVPAKAASRDTASATPPDTITTLVREAFFDSGKDSMSASEYVDFLADVYRDSGLFDSVEVKLGELYVRRIGSKDVEVVVVPWTVHRSSFDHRAFDTIPGAAEFIREICNALRSDGVYLFGDSYSMGYPAGDRAAIKQEIENGPGSAKLIPDHDPLNIAPFVRDLEAARQAAFADEDLANCPYLAQWLSIWAPDSVNLAPTSFDTWYVSSLRDVRWRDSIGPGFTVPVEGYVTSPDSSYAIWMSTPGDEPDSEVDLVDLRHGRQRMLLASGTPGDYEMAWWLSKDVALVAGGDWDRTAPMLFRIDVSKQTLESFRGPSVPSDRSRQIGEARRALWHQRFSSQK